MSDAPPLTGKLFKEHEKAARQARLATVRSLLVANYSNKEIAIELGVSEVRARKDVKDILDELGVDNRRTAGRILAKQLGVHDIPGPLQTLPSHSLFQPLAQSAEEAGQSNRVMEERAHYVVSRQSPDIGMPFRTRGGTRNDLSLLQRLVWMMLIACIGFSAIGIMSLGLTVIR